MKSRWFVGIFLLGIFLCVTAGMTALKSKLPVLPPLGKTLEGFHAISILIPDSKVFKSTVEKKRKAHPKLRVVEVSVLIDGRYREFTVEEFKRRLGFRGYGAAGVLEMRTDNSRIEFIADDLYTAE